MTDQLTEISGVRQIEGEQRRRWFSSLTLDLIVWVDQSNCPTGFQFCHRVGTNEHALTWRPSKGFTYARVDSGDYGRVGYKQSPILLVNGAPNLPLLLKTFAAASETVPEDIHRFVVGALSPPERK